MNGRDQKPERPLDTKFVLGQLKLLKEAHATQDPETIAQAWSIVCEGLNERTKLGFAHGRVLAILEDAVDRIHEMLLFETMGRLKHRSKARGRQRRLSAQRRA